MDALITIFAYNRPGVLDRIAGIVRKRGWNIDGLTAGSLTGGLMQISLSITGQHIDVPELGDRLSELHDVESWEECSLRDHFIREILLLSYLKDSGQGEVISRIGGIKTIEEGKDGRVYAECTGSPEEIAAKYDLLRENAVSCVRIGKMILAKKGERAEDGKRNISGAGN